MFGFSKRYIIRITMFDEREVCLVSALENWGEYNRSIIVDKNHPLTVMLKEPRNYWKALFRCMRYWKMGIDTCILRN